MQYMDFLTSLVILSGRHDAASKKATPNRLQFAALDMGYFFAGTLLEVSAQALAALGSLFRLSKSVDIRMVQAYSLYRRSPYTTESQSHHLVNFGWPLRNLSMYLF